MPRDDWGRARAKDVGRRTSAANRVDGIILAQEQRKKSRMAKAKKNHHKFTIKIGVPCEVSISGGAWQAFTTKKVNRFQKWEKVDGGHLIFAKGEFQMRVEWKYVNAA